MTRVLNGGGEIKKVFIRSSSLSTTILPFTIMAIFGLWVFLFFSSLSLSAPA